jgi:outer membrane protein OmpA-like peptidoglycan-associated protein
MHARILKSVGWGISFLFLALMPVALWGQAAAASSGSANTEISPSKWDIFAGYSALIPDKDICCYPAGKVFGYNSIDYGSIFSVTRYFNNHVGIRFEGDLHLLLPESNITSTQPGDDFGGGYGGVVFRIPMSNGKVIPSFHFMAGAERVGSIPQADVFGFAFTLGGSLDVRTPAFDHHLSIRLYQADYQYLHANFAAAEGGSQTFNPQGRLSAGLVWNIGTFAPPVPITLACSASPETIFLGDPVTLTASAGGLNPKDHVIYTWTGTGVTGNDSNPRIDTSALAPGEYTVTGTVKEGRAGREGMRPWETATCTAGITVKAFEPPTISCSASPSTIKPGDGSTITSIGVSPQNRPLTYSYTASAGSITGSGTTGEYSSAGAPTGAVGITCNVSDDKGHTESSSTSLTITAPYVPPAPKTQALCSISFANDKRRPTRVDNEAKACLDQVALDLKQQADATVVVVGESGGDENAKTAREQSFAAQRAVNAKDYLVTEQGIDASRISVATGTTEGQTEENYLVPAGATFTTDVTGTTPVDETAVKPQARKPLRERHPHEAAQ